MNTFKYVLSAIVIVVAISTGFVFAKTYNTADLRSQLLEILTKIQEIQKQLDQLKKEEELASAAVAEKTVSVVSPVINAELIANKSYEIKWASAGFTSYAPVKIELLDDRFDQNLVAGKMLITNTSNLGVFVWSVPETIGNTVLSGGMYKISVTIGEGSNTKTALSNGYIAIKKSSDSAYLKMFSPNGGEQLMGNEKTIIKWDALGFGNSKITLTLYKGTTKTLVIADKITNNGNYEWQIPNGLSGNYKIQLNATDSLGNSDGQDYSDNVFKISTVGI